MPSICNVVDNDDGDYDDDVGRVGNDDDNHHSLSMPWRSIELLHCRGNNSVKFKRQSTLWP